MKEEQERQGWWVVFSLALVQFILLGPTYGTLGYFYSPWIKEFGWNHAKVAVTTSAFLFAQALISPIVGWLLDRIPAQIVMTVAALATAAGYLWASNVHSFAPMVAAFAVIGAGVSASTYVPAMMVAANWFTDRRGLALGIVLAGAALGGTALSPVVELILVTYGWRAAMVWVTVPMFLIAIPVILLIVRTRPASASETRTVRQQADALRGLEVGAALASLPFWMLVATEFVYNIGYQGFVHHLMTYYIGAGFRPERAALILGLLTFFTMVGAISLGNFADRRGVRVVLATSMVGLAVGISLVLGATSQRFGSLWGMASMVGAGLSVGSTATLLPAILAEALGLRRYGTLWGIIRLIGWIGGGIGPFAAGQIFDHTGTYALSFEFCAICMLVAACTAAMIRPAEELVAQPVPVG
ncbi:MAG TPA: MFS transporter [Candidatus Binataceae bacterium]|nr:MFS transporter [Candidatus Binataceae bacterium]